MVPWKSVNDPVAGCHHPVNVQLLGMRAEPADLGEADITVHYEARAVPARPGSSIAAALTAAGIRACRRSDAGDRGLFCGMGVCGECSIEVDASSGKLACMTPVHDGMRLRRQPAAARADLTASPQPCSAEHVLQAEVVVVGGGPAG